MEHLYSLIAFPLLCALLGVVPAVAQDEAARERELDLESFDYVWNTVRDKHWDPELGGLDWEAVRKELRPRAEAATSREELREILREMLGRLGQSHFGIIPGGAYDELQAEEDAVGEAAEGEVTEGEGGKGAPKKKKLPPVKPGTGEMGLRVAVVDGGVLVSGVDEGSPAAGAGVAVGWEVVALDGRKLSRLIETVERVHGDAMVELYAALSVAHRLKGTPGEPTRVTFLDVAGEETEKVIDYAAPKGRLFSFGHMPPTRVWIESRRIGEDVGHVRFNLFMDPVTIIKKFGAAMESFKDCAGVIIDVRDNGGGIGFMANRLSGFFVDDRTQSLGNMLSRRSKIAFVVNPNLETYGGFIAILVDGASASTSEIFAGGLQTMKRARIFGSRTAGAALPSHIEKLPNGDRFQFAVADLLLPDGKRLEGVGVAPDVEVKHTRESLRAGRDAALEAAATWIRQSKKKKTQGDSK